MRVRRRRNLDNLFFKSFGYGLEFLVELEFFVNVAEVERNGVNTDIKSKDERNADRISTIRVLLNQIRSALRNERALGRCIGRDSPLRTG